MEKYIKEKWIPSQNKKMGLENSLGRTEHTFRGSLKMIRNKAWELKQESTSVKSMGKNAILYTKGSS
jgi:hypothetical protein